MKANRFPLKLATGGRHLLDANDQPFLIRGRSAWYLISQSREQRQRFLDDTASKGFNAIEIKAITHDKNGFRPRFAGNDTVPFTHNLSSQRWHGAAHELAPDFAQTNEPYWDYLDSLLDDAEARGICVLLFPAYVGYDGGEQGWMQEMVANGVERMRNYGAWIAQRYQHRGNLIWMLGGDYSNFKDDEQAVEAALIAGLKSVPDQTSRFYSAEWHSDSYGSDHPTFGDEVNLNGVYSWENSIAKYARAAYATEPARPAFLLEEPYDEEGPDGSNYNPNATQPVRRFIYWGWLNTMGGYVA
ncbi:MAG: DUF4038 domain-containing protein, partial [Planctomycetales bacterium]|nr:DUF4038 domain-containing protein [Planctomycetales bacterium]